MNNEKSHVANGSMIAIYPPICCDGYVLMSADVVNYDCKSKCSEECPENEHCTKKLAYTCTCDAGYHRLNSSGSCTKKCQLDCFNSFCKNEHECMCYDGLVQIDSLLCVPQQSNATECQNKCKKYGHCNEEGKCICDEGYFTASEFDCKPMIGNFRRSSDKAGEMSSASMTRPIKVFCNTISIILTTKLLQSFSI